MSSVQMAASMNTFSTCNHNFKGATRFQTIVRAPKQVKLVHIRLYSCIRGIVKVHGESSQCNKYTSILYDDQSG